MRHARREKRRRQTKRGLPFGKKWWNPWKGSKWHTGSATNWNDTGETLMIDKYKSYKSIPFYPGSKRWLNCLPRRVTFSQDTLHPCPWSLSQRVSPHRMEIRTTAYSTNNSCWYDKTSEKSSSTSEQAVVETYVRDIKNTLWQRSFTNRSLTGPLPHLHVSYRYYISLQRSYLVCILYTHV